MTVGPRLDATPPGLPPPPAGPPDPVAVNGDASRIAGLVHIGVLLAVVICWAALALTAGALAATVAGFTLSPLHAVFQMALPYAVVALAVPLLLAALTRRRALAVASGVLLIVAAALIAPAARPGAGPPPSPDDLTLFVANLRYDNPTPEAKADQVLQRDEDVLVVVELTPGFLDRLDEGGIDTTHPYRIVYPLWGSHGAGIFSKRPLQDAGMEPIGKLHAPAATISTPDGPVRIVAVHTRPPVSNEYRPVWQRDLLSLRTYSAGLTMPTVLAGDYNATRWHPGFRSILDLGLLDAHEEMGQGLSFSWPAAGRLDAFLSPFSRLDHALLFDADATAIENLPADGSDHLPFSVRVRPDRPDTVEP